MSDGPQRDAATAAEERLLDHMEDLRRHPPRVGDELVGAVVATARWQAAVRPYLVGMGALARAAAVGVGAALAGTRKDE